ncbi:MAG TPA: peptidoglycan DD-metalloendopeptidase family protein [Candidatus Paceibacterota bacterium]|nr:peptidoglycan DD-metalloendopeptidase family protein [Candidatus Paceibacterota bacterium]
MKTYTLCFILALFCGVTVVAAQSNAPMNWWRIVTPATAGVDEEVAALPQTAEQNLKLPILIGIAPGSFAKNYGIVYSNGSVHQGQDIFAPRGAYIVSPTVAVVTRIDLAGAGGIAVYTANPGNETFYYAHMTAVGPTIHVGAQLQPGDLIGYVGNTGDAEGASTHLHFQIFDKDVGVIDPNPRLTQAFSDDERIAALANIIARSDNRQLAANAIVNLYRSYLTSLPPTHVPFPIEIQNALSGTTNTLPTVQTTTATATPVSAPTVSTVTAPTPTATTNATSTSTAPVTAVTTPAVSVAIGAISQDLSAGMRNDDVKILQQYLINKHVGIYGQTLTQYGPTGYFGVLTRAALIEFQRSVGISGSGFCGPITRAYIASHM